MKKISKPWGSEEIWAHTEQYVGKIIHIIAGNKLSLQYHEEKIETIYVIKGPMILEGRENSPIVLNETDSYHIPTGVVHRFCAPPENDVVLVEVSTPELNDVVRIQDDYGRV